MTPLDRVLGFDAVVAGELRLAPQPALCNHRGGVHGAALSALLGAAAESAARAQGPRWAAVRIRSLQVQFLRPGLGPLVARARVTGGGQTLCFCQATVHDDQGQPVAQALATLSLPSTQEKTP